MANIVVSSKTQTTIDVYIDNLDTNYSFNDRYIDWYEGSSYCGTTYLAAGVAYGGDFTYDGLSAFTEYILSAVIYYNNGNVTLWDDSEYTRPNEFSWSSAKIQGGEFSLSASEWNTLTANINQVRIYRGYSSTSFTSVSTNDPVTASIYNEAVTGIQGIYGYGSYLYTVTAGDKIYAYDFNNLASELNAVP